MGQQPPSEPIYASDETVAVRAPEYPEESAPPALIRGGDGETFTSEGGGDDRDTRTAPFHPTPAAEGGPKGRTRAESRRESEDSQAAEMRSLRDAALEAGMGVLREEMAAWMSQATQAAEEGEGQARPPTLREFVLANEPSVSNGTRPLEGFIVGNPEYVQIWKQVQGGNTIV